MFLGSTSFGFIIKYWRIYANCIHIRVGQVACIALEMTRAWVGVRYIAESMLIGWEEHEPGCAWYSVGVLTPRYWKRSYDTFYPIDLRGSYLSWCLHRGYRPKPSSTHKACPRQVGNVCKLRKVPPYIRRKGSLALPWQLVMDRHKGSGHAGYISLIG